MVTYSTKRLLFEVAFAVVSVRRSGGELSGGETREAGGALRGSHILLF